MRPMMTFEWSTAHGLERRKTFGVQLLCMCEDMVVLVRAAAETRPMKITKERDIYI
jgi:hypothetical protein